MKDEIISAFTFNVAKQIEQICEERNGGLQKQLETLQANILRFRQDLVDSGQSTILKHFDIMFDIKSER